MIETERGGRGRRKNKSDGEKEKQYPQAEREVVVGG